MNALAKSLDDLREKRILGSTRAPPSACRCAGPAGRWCSRAATPAGSSRSRSSDPPTRRPSTSLLSDLSFLRASGFVDAPTPDASRPCWRLRSSRSRSDSSPSRKAESARELKLAIGGRESEEGDRLARADGGPALFRIPSERLHDFPREVGSYRFRELARFDLDQAERLEIVFQPPGEAAVTVTAIRGERGLELDTGELSTP